MPNYAPELAASAEHDYLHTAKTIEQIARDHGVSSRDVNRMRERGGWPMRRDRIRRIPHATQLLREATALQATPVPAVPAAIERIERLFEEEFAALEASRAQLGKSPPDMADAERRSDTLLTLAEIAEVLQHLRGGRAPEQKIRA